MRIKASEMQPGDLFLGSGVNCLVISVKRHGMLVYYQFFDLMGSTRYGSKLGSSSREHDLFFECEVYRLETK